MISPELIEWLTQNTRTIEKKIEDHRAEFLGTYRFDFELIHSDSMLCGSIMCMPLPPNYHIQNLQVSAPWEIEFPSHTVALSGSEILDFFAGQFYTNEAKEIPGIARMLPLAPQLFHILTSEIIALSATQKEIKKYLYLDYQF